jgi:hypothetical protein
MHTRIYTPSTHRLKYVLPKANSYRWEDFDTQYLMSDIRRRQGYEDAFEQHLAHQAEERADQKRSAAAARKVSAKRKMEEEADADEEMTNRLASCSEVGERKRLKRGPATAATVDVAIEDDVEAVDLYLIGDDGDDCGGGAEACESRPQRTSSRLQHAAGWRASRGNLDSIKRTDTITAAKAKFDITTQTLWPCRSCKHMVKKWYCGDNCRKAWNNSQRTAAQRSVENRNRKRPAAQRQEEYRQRERVDSNAAHYKSKKAKRAHV